MHLSQTATNKQVIKSVAVTLKAVALLRGACWGKKQDYSYLIKCHKKSGKEELKKKWRCKQGYLI